MDWSERSADERVLDVLCVGPDSVPLAALWSVDLLVDVDIAEAVTRLEADRHVSASSDGQLFVAAPVRLDVGTRMGAIERAHLRGALGRSLRDSAMVAATEVATMLVDGLAARPDPSVLPWIVDTGNRSVREGHITQAIDLLEIASEAIDHGAPAPAVLRVRILSRLSYLLRWVDRRDDAEMLLARTASLARSDPDLLAVAALTWTPRQIAVSDDPSGFALLDDALARLPDTDAALRPLLLASRATALVFTDLDDARRTAVEALDLARASDDAETFILAAYAHRVTHWHPSAQANTLSLANEMVARAPQAIDYAEYGPLTRLQVFLETGDFDHLDGELAAMKRRLSSQPRPFEELWYTTVAAARAQVRGNWAEARVLTDRALALGDGAAYDVGFQLLLGQSVLVAWQLGDDLRSLVENALPAGPLRSSWESCLLGWTCTWRPADEVRADLDRLLEFGMESIRPDLTFGPVSSSLAMAAAEVAAIDHAAVLYDGLLPYLDQWAGTGGAVSNGPFALHLGRLAAVLGRTSDAALHLSLAAELCRRADAGPWEARTELALGLLPGVDAASHLDRAILVAEALTMTEVVAIARRHRGTTARPAGLSARECEVLTLLARGATNKVIADTLFLSVKTVERHLLNTYRKIEARGRAEATAFAIRNGLG